MNVCHLIPQNLEDRKKQLIDRMAEELRSEQIAFYKIALSSNSKFSLSLLSQVRKEIKKNKATVLHIHDATLIPLGVAAAKSCFIKAVATIYDVPEKRVGRWWLGALDQLVFGSQYTREQFQLRYPLRKPAQVIPSAVIVETIPAAPLSRAEWQIKEDSIVVASIGPLERSEDPITLLKAFRRLQKKSANAILLMAGEGSIKGQVEDFIKSENLQQSIRMLNGHIESQRLLSLADIYVTSCFGYSKEEEILRAMALRKPVIATKIFNHQELIDDGRTGILVPCGYPERIETAIMRFTIKKDEMQAMGQAAGEAAVRNFSIPSVAQQYRQAYQSWS